MTITELSQQWAHLKICENRKSGDEYIELVFLTADTDQWTAIFSSVLGPAVKEAGVKPDPGHLELTRNHGGIYDDQTLFTKKFAENMIIAMFWPWQDGSHTTLKLTEVKTPR